MRTFWRLLGLLRPYRAGVVASFVLAAAAMGMGVLVPYLVGRTVDDVRGDGAELELLVWALIGAGVLRLVFSVVRRLVAGDWPMDWSGKYYFASDDPLKATMPDQDPGRSVVVQKLLPLIQSMQTELTVISPYFVPGEEVTASWVKSVEAGKRVRVLTNSLIANDVAAVHGGYVRYRERLVEGGVQVWELKPLAGSNVHSSLVEFREDVDLGR